jgi:hypothetical protein
MNDRQELIRRFAVAIAGAHQTRAFRAHDVALEEIWRIATSLADREPPQPEPQPEHTREDWAEVQGDVKRLTKDVERLSGTVEALKARIRCAARLVRETSHELACGYAVSEDTVERAVKILEEGSDD